MRHNTAIIGCGRISYKHVDAMIDNSEYMRLVAVCDPIIERAEKRKKQYFDKGGESEAVVYANYKEMLECEQPEIVTVATESGYHPQIVIDALESGSHVIVEKPMALSTSDAKRMIEAARRNHRKLAVSFQNRFNPPVQKTYQALKDGRFGKMLHGMIQIRWNRNEGYYQQASWRGTWELDGGTLMNQCTHGIDLLQWLLGEDVVRVHGVTRRFLRPIEAEDFGGAILEFKSGAVGIIEGSADVYPENLNETLSLFGEKGTVVIGGMAVNKFETWRFADQEQRGDDEASVMNAEVKNPPNVYGFGHTPLFFDFVHAIEENREPFVNGENGKKALEIILAIYRSMKEGKPVDLPSDFDTLKMKGIFDKK